MVLVFAVRPIGPITPSVVLEHLTFHEITQPSQARVYAR